MVAILKIFSAPLIWIFIFLVLGLVFTRDMRTQGRIKKTGWNLLAAGVAILFFLSFKPAANLLVYSLESGFPSFSTGKPPKINVMVILGGGIAVSGGFRAHPEPTATTYARVFKGVEAFKKSGAEILILSGGAIERAGETEAAVMKDLAVQLGVNDAFILTETKSRTTLEQAKEIKKMIALGRDTRIGLVTSAMHMKRSLRTFRKFFPDNAIVAIPVNYIYSPFQWSYRTFIPSAEVLVCSTTALHEWIGQLWYNLAR